MNRSKPLLLVLMLGLISLARAFAGGDANAPITFTGGHETDPKDGGRPVVLIAAALGVKTEVFRDAFSRVKPAKDGKPTKEEADRNKQALMMVLKPYGVTNERLDEVSDYYRYKPGKGSLWKTTPAKAHAVLEGAKIKRIVVTESGSGFTTAPKATIQGMENVKLNVIIQFNKDLKKNGTISSIELE